jgi:hypothetical protein
MAQEPQPNPGLQVQVTLPPDLEVGSFADFVRVWHTPSTFVLDFVSVKQPTHPSTAPEGGPNVLEAKVASRVRIPSEQIFPLIHALTEQGNHWLRESGRSEPPANWLS